MERAERACAVAVEVDCLVIRPRSARTETEILLARYLMIRHDKPGTAKRQKGASEPRRSKEQSRLLDHSINSHLHVKACEELMSRPYHIEATHTIT